MSGPTKPSARASSLLQVWLPAAAVAAGLVLVAGPIVSTLARSVLASDTRFDDFTIANFVGLALDRGIRSGAVNTIITGLGATLFSSLLGCTLAWIVARTD